MVTIAGFTVVAFISRGLLYTGGHYSRFYCSGLYKQGIVIHIGNLTVVAPLSRGLSYTVGH